ncbi:unnamed protein product, partial [Penicillium glandicola]
MASLGLTYLESDLDSDPEIVPESPPAVPSTQPTTETFTFPLPPLNQHFRTLEEGIEAVNTFARPYGYTVTSRRSKSTKKGVKKIIRLICDRG